MKSLFLATAALAAFAAAPAFAQDSVGSVGVNYSKSEFDVVGLDADLEVGALDLAFATPITADWTVTVDTGFSLVMDGAANEDDGDVNGRVHLSREFAGLRVAAFAGGATLSEGQLWSFGAQAQKAIDKLTLTGALSYETIESTDADIWTLGGDASYFVTPNFRLNGGAGWTNVDVAGGDTDGWQANVGGEYQFANSGTSIVAGYTHGEFEDLDLKVDTFNIGLRFSFGGDLQARERSGADLGRTVAGLGTLAGAF